ncbi:MAG: metalloregulator ArsR/SmtB family transcription factor [bacterium]|nr:metalloregulator ArsR/SmtB family transcription factor [bacterium]
MKNEQRWTVVFKAFANINRIKILKLLAGNKKMNVGDISTALKISFSATSNHLIMLQKLEVLEVEGRSGHVFYSINSDMPTDFHKTTYSFLH